MDTPETARPNPPRAVVVGLVAGWIIIVAKCVFMPTIIARWQIPIHPGWVIVPTLTFAALVTWLALTHDWTRDRE